MKAVVMAGGFGTRIAPLTNSIPKPMLPILNKPMMEDVIVRLREIGVKEFIVLLYFKPEVIQDYFKDGSDLGIKIKYVIPDDDYGTAGAVKKAAKLIGKNPFIVVSGDLITDFDFQKILDFHKAKKSKVTITLTSVTDPLQFGVVICDSEGKIKRFLEKPSWGEVFSDTINTGIYVFEPEILDEIPENVNFDFSKDLFPKLMKNNLDLWGYDARGYWRDVGNPLSYRDVVEDILAGSVNFTFKGEKLNIDKGVLYVGEGVHLGKDIQVKGVNILADAVTIEPGVTLQNCVIGANTIIDKNASVKNSTLWDGCYVGEKAVINNCVVCSNTSIAKKCEISQGAIIAEKCELEQNVKVAKDVIIWPNKLIEESSIISQNVIWGDRYKRSIFEGGKVRGHSNVELSCGVSVKLGESFGTLLPIGSKVYVSRDYHHASRMLKHAFVGGLLASGIEIVNSRFVPSNILINSLLKNDEIEAGVHFRQSETNALETEILFYDKNGMLINTTTEKNCERVFFRENFRRVSNGELGDITDDNTLVPSYLKRFTKKIDAKSIILSNSKFLFDLLYGTTSTVFPEILNRLSIENIMVNSYFDDKKLSKLPINIVSSEENAKKIIRTLGFDGGFLIYPHGKKLELVCDNGNLLPSQISLLVVLWLLNELSTSVKKVYLPVFAPDILDSQFSKLKIKRSKINNLKFDELSKYDLISDCDGCFAFSEFGINYDAMFSSVKIIELLALAQMKISQIVAKIPKFFYTHEVVECNLELKGFMMRKFTAEAMGKESSFEDGVKIIEQDLKVTMIPDQYAENLHLYIEAKDEAAGKKALSAYREKIAAWIQEGSK
ncbi:MAG: sugar phosphate nucleotidyltransferase [Helicobacteraceae bacterium]